MEVEALGGSVPFKSPATLKAAQRGEEQTHPWPESQECQADLCPPTLWITNH